MVRSDASYWCRTLLEGAGTDALTPGETHGEGERLTGNA
jgi:hypothetical protein